MMEDKISLIANGLSIISFFISLWAAKQVYSIKQTIKTAKQTGVGKNVNQSITQ